MPEPVTDDMVKRGAAALTEPSGEVYEVRVPDPMVAHRIAEQVLSAGLAGCADRVDALPVEHLRNVPPAGGQ